MRRKFDIGTYVRAVTEKGIRFGHIERELEVKGKLFVRILDDKKLEYFWSNTINVHRWMQR